MVVARPEGGLEREEGVADLSRISIAVGGREMRNREEGEGPWNKAWPLLSGEGSLWVGPSNANMPISS